MFLCLWHCKFRWTSPGAPSESGPHLRRRHRARNFTPARTPARTNNARVCECSCDGSRTNFRGRAPARPQDAAFGMVARGLYGPRRWPVDSRTAPVYLRPTRDRDAAQSEGLHEGIPTSGQRALREGRARRFWSRWVVYLFIRVY